MAPPNYPRRYDALIIFVLLLLQRPLLSPWQIQSKDFLPVIKSFKIILSTFPNFISLHAYLFLGHDEIQSGFLTSGLFSSYAYILYFISSSVRG